MSQQKILHKALTQQRMTQEKKKGFEKEKIHENLPSRSGTRQEFLVVSDKLISGWILGKNKKFSVRSF